MNRPIAALALVAAVTAAGFAAATQDDSAPKNLTLTRVENEQEPYRFRYVGTDETIEARALTAEVLAAAPVSTAKSAKEGPMKRLVILKSGSYVATNTKTGQVKRENFASLQMTFTPTGELIERTITR